MAYIKINKITKETSPLHKHMKSDLLVNTGYKQLKTNEARRRLNKSERRK